MRESGGDIQCAARVGPAGLLTEPTPGTCTPSTASGNGYTATNGATISQGTYCGGITVQGGATLNLNSGLYILDGGGRTVGGGSNIIGSGVTFYNTGTGSGPSAYKPITVSGGSTTSLTAPTTGNYAGIFFSRIAASVLTTIIKRTRYPAHLGPSLRVRSTF